MRNDCSGCRRFENNHIRIWFRSSFGSGTYWISVLGHCCEKVWFGSQSNLWLCVLLFLWVISCPELFFYFFVCFKSNWSLWSWFSSAAHPFTSWRIWNPFLRVLCILNFLMIHKSIFSAETLLAAAFCHFDVMMVAWFFASIRGKWFRTGFGATRLIIVPVDGFHLHSFIDFYSFFIALRNLFVMNLLKQKVFKTQLPYPCKASGH